MPSPLPPRGRPCRLDATAASRTIAAWPVQWWPLSILPHCRSIVERPPAPLPPGPWIAVVAALHFAMPPLDCRAASLHVASLPLDFRVGSLHLATLLPLDRRVGCSTAASLPPSRCWAACWRRSSQHRRRRGGRSGGAPCTGTTAGGWVGGCFFLGGGGGDRCMAGKEKQPGGCGMHAASSIAIRL